MPIDATSIQKARESGYSPAEITEFLAAKGYGDKIMKAREAGYGDDEIISHLEKSGNKIPSGNSEMKSENSQDDGLIGRIGEDLGERKQNLAEAGKRTLYGQQNIGSGMLQAIGEGAGAAIDVGGEVISSVTPQAVKDAAGYVGEKILETDIGKMGLEAFRQGEEAYNAFKQKYPVAAENIESIGNIAALVTPVKGKSLASVTEGTGREGLKKAAYKLREMGYKDAYPTGQEIKDISGELFTQARERGAQFSPNVVNDLFKESTKHLPKGDIAKSLIKPDAADDFILAMKDQQGKSMTLEDFESIDRHLGDRAHAAFANDPALSRKYSDMQGTLRELISDPKNIAGNAKGIEAHREATRLWGIAKRLEDIERIIDDADLYEVPSTAIKTGFRRIAKSPKLMRGYTAAERKAIKRAASTGRLEGIFKTFGSRLTAIIGGSVGGIPGAMTGYGVSEGGRAVTETMKRGQGGKVARSLQERSGLVKREPRISTEKMKEIMKMPPRKAQELLNKSKGK